MTQLGATILRVINEDTGLSSLVTSTLQEGGPGSGFHGHAGRPGVRGGSAPGGGSSAGSGVQMSFGLGGAAGAPISGISKSAADRLRGKGLVIPRREAGLAAAMAKAGWGPKAQAVVAKWAAEAKAKGAPKAKMNPAQKAWATRRANAERAAKAAGEVQLRNRAAAQKAAVIRARRQKDEPPPKPGITSKPPKFISPSNIPVWRDVVRKGEHKRYPSAVAHFKARIAKMAREGKLPAAVLKVAKQQPSAKTGITSKPPKWITPSKVPVWRDVVQKGGHKQYPGAVAHFKARLGKMAREGKLNAKWGKWLKAKNAEMAARTDWQRKGK